jgi:glycosyltransferase involved in cell wall biosynthesis
VSIGRHVSVVLPTRDRHRQLAAALTCALGQQGVRVEVVVVDDGSEPGALAGVPALDDPRVRVVRAPLPGGVSHARNLGVGETRARWVAFLDDDDLWAPEKLALQLDALDAAGGTFSYTGTVVCDQRRRPLAVSPAPPADGLVRRLLRTNAVGTPSSVVVERSAFERSGGFDPAFSALADWDLWLRLATGGVAAPCPPVLTAYSEHGRNMVLNEADELEAQMERLRAKHGALSEALGEPLGDVEWSRWIASCYRRARRRRRAARAYWAAGVAHRSLRDLAMAPALLLAAGGRLPQRSPRVLPAAQYPWLEAVAR